MEVESRGVGALPGACAELSSEEKMGLGGEVWRSGVAGANRRKEQGLGGWLVGYEAI